MTQKTDLDLDLEWPTFEQNDNYATYSPEDEREKIFSDFTLATEDHKIRNKKRKPKKKRVLRLVSESEVYGRRKTCDRKKVIVISVLVTCIVIIVAVCIFLGVYFGTMKKSSESGNTAAIVDTKSTSSSTRVPPSTPTTTAPDLPPITSPTTTTPKKLATTTTTTSTATTTTTSTTTTTTPTTTTTTPTTTTTTPAPTEPPTLEYTGSDEEKERVVNTTKKCREKIIKFTSNLSEKEKCSLYYEMLRCVYIRLVSDRLLVPVPTLGQTVEENAFIIFPSWIAIDPASCRENGELDIRNMTSLPVTAEGICTSPDAALYYGKHVCNLINPNNQGGINRISEVEKCTLLWSTTGCVADVMGCSHDDMVVVMEHEQLVQGLQFESVNQTLCNELFTDIESSSTCQPLLYNYVSVIYNQCARTIKQGSKLITGYECTLFEAFFQCSYEQIPEVTRYKECTNEKDSLRQVAFDIASAARKVDLTFPFVDVQGCIDNPEASTYICRSPDRLVPVIDSICYETFKSLTSPSVTCSVLSEYVYTCAADVNANLRLECSEDHIKAAIIAQSDVIKSKYGVDIAEQFYKENCIAPPAS